MGGQCIVYDHLLRDGARDMLRGKVELETTKARPGIFACGKIFLATVSMLTRMQRRAEAGLAFGRPIEETSGVQPAAEPEGAPLAASEAPAPPPSIRLNNPIRRGNRRPWHLRPARSFRSCIRRRPF